MSKQKPTKEQFKKLKTRQILEVARDGGCQVETGGRHPCVVKNGVRVPVPSHGDDIPLGTKLSIWRSFAALGLVLFILACAMGALYAGLGV